jgi:ubiquitin carboxyl-terminal hydrolase 5/13
MVEDPLLAEHLSHWGIDVMTMEKTEKSMAELQIDLNKGFEFDKITESGAELESVSGPNLVGLANLGNTCYVASVAQVLKTLPAVVDRYVAPAMDLARGAPADVTCDFPAQMSKLCVGLVTDKYARAETVTNAGAHESAVNPRMFKNLVGRGHAEFSTGRQQDAVEFFQHLLEQMTREEHKAKARLGDAPPTASQFEFEVEEKTTCVESGAVRYVTRRDNVLPLDVPVESATNAAAVSEFKERELKRQKTSSEGSGGGGGGGKEKADDEEPVRPVVPFDACVAKIAAPELVDDFYSTALGRKGTASKTTRMKTMPNVLAVQVRRYYVAEDWTAKKLDALVPMPTTMDLESSLRGRGMQPGETPLPDPEGPASAEAAADGKGNGSSATVTTTTTTTTTVEPSAEIVAQLVSMGFSENGSKRAAIATNNVSADGAMEWVFAHMEDADFNDPPTAVTSAQSAAATSPASEVGTNPESLMMLTSMGFADAHATAALKRSGGDVERAADWLFSHSDDLDAACAEVMSGGGDDGNGGGNGSSVGVSPPESPVVDGVGRYELFGVVSHLGSNTACGHYVAHVLVDGTWCIFNDRKVAKSANVPLDLGYLYFYRRTA